MNHLALPRSEVHILHLHLMFFQHLELVIGHPKNHSSGAFLAGPKVHLLTVSMVLNEKTTIEVNNKWQLGKAARMLVFISEIRCL